MNTTTIIHRSALALAGALVLLTGCKKKEEAPVPVPKAAKALIISAEKNSFEEVTAKLDPGGNLFCYMSTEQALERLSNRVAAASNLLSNLPNIPGTGRQNLGNFLAVLSGVINESGISQVSGLGASSIAREPGFYYSKVVIHHYPGRNAGLIWSLFGREAHPLRQLDMLPESTALAFGSDFDLPLIWKKLRQEADSLGVPGAAQTLEQAPAQFRQVTGLDFDEALRSLGGEYGVLLTLDRSNHVTLPIAGTSMNIPKPALALLLKVNSDLIYDSVRRLAQSNAVVKMLLSEYDEPGLKMLTVNVPDVLRVGLRPSLARSGDYLVLASSDSLVREMVAVKSGQRKGFTATAKFRRLSQGIPSQGNNFDLDTGALSAAFGQSLTNEVNDAEVSTIMKTARQLWAGGTNTSSFGIGANNADGWEGIANGRQSLHALVAPAVIVAGVVAAIAIPRMHHAQATTTTRQDVPSAGAGPAHLAGASPMPPAQAQTDQTGGVLSEIAPPAGN